MKTRTGSRQIRIKCSAFVSNVLQYQYAVIPNFCYNKPRPAYRNGVSDIQDIIFCRGVINIEMNNKTYASYYGVSIAVVDGNYVVVHDLDVDVEVVVVHVVVIEHRFQIFKMLGVKFSDLFL